MPKTPEDRRDKTKVVNVVPEATDEVSGTISPERAAAAARRIIQANRELFRRLAK